MNAIPLPQEFVIPEDWPQWLIILALIIASLRGTLVKLLPEAWRSHQEHREDMAEIELNAKLQKTASEQLRSSWREERLIEIIQRNQDFLQEMLTTQQQTQRVEFKNLQSAVLRIGDIAVATFTHARKSNGENLIKMSQEVEDAIKGVDNE